MYLYGKYYDEGSEVKFKKFNKEYTGTVVEFTGDIEDLVTTVEIEIPNGRVYEVLTSDIIEVIEV